MAAKRMSASQLDEAARERESLKARVEAIDSKLKEQIEEYGFLPPRAEKSKRLCGEEYELTLSEHSGTEVKDTEVLKIATVCDPEVFQLLFKPVTKYKVMPSALGLLARSPLPEGLPSNIRMLWSRAVITKEKAPRLTIKLAKEVVGVS